MASFLPNTDVVTTFDLVDEETFDIIDPASATYDVYDEEGTQITINGAVTVTGGEEKLSVTVPAVDNSLAGETEGARTVVLYVTATTGATYTLTKTYLLIKFAFLQVPADSGMTLPQSMLLSDKMAQSVLEAWTDSEDGKKTAALREAWTRLSRIPFLPWRDFEEIPDSATVAIREGNFSLNTLSVDEWASLPKTFKDSLKRAQLIEAAVILDGDPTWDRRQDGLISKTVGESSEMFSSKKAAFSTISPKSRREISPYIRRQVRLGRA